MIAPADASGSVRRIIGRYALYDALAAGGMATVHLGRLIGPVGFARTVAIKRLHENFAADPEFVAAFLDEARLAARIRHPNVVPTLDVVATQGQLFVVMEYVQGESLARLLKAGNRQPVPVRIAIAIMAGALHGLHAAHEAKNEKGEPLEIVHRDVSPQNVLVGIDGVPRVLDFGVAKAAGRMQTTQSGQLKGKVAYMSPEQLRSEPVDRRTDVFAAAVVLWETLLGKRLFAAPNEGAVVTNVLTAEIEPPSKHAPGIPPELDAIVMRGLERDPTKRYQTAREMAIALEEVVAPATSTQVGAWVEGLASTTLKERAMKVAEIESQSSQPGEVAQALSEIRSSDAVDAFPPAPSSKDDLLTVSSKSSVSLARNAPTEPPPERKSRAWVALLGGGVLLLLAAAIGYAVFAGRSPGPSAAASSRSSGASVVSSSSSVAAPASASAPAAASSPQASSVASAAPSPSAGPSTRPVATGHGTPAATGTAGKKVDCTNPTTRDELGRKIYKPECLE